MGVASAAIITGRGTRIPDYVVLKNRRAMGTIPGHRVRVKDRKGESKPAVPLVQELGTRYSEPAGPSPTSSAYTSGKFQFF